MKHVYVILIVPLSILIPLGTGGVHRVYHHKHLKIIYLYLGIVVAIEISARLIGERGINNLPLLHFYTITEFLFILRFFQLVLNTLPTYRLINWLMGIFTLFCVIDFSFIQSIYQFNSYPRPLAALIITGFCLFYFYRSTDISNQKRWRDEPLNWILAGMLVYFGSSFFYFAFLNILYEKASLTVNYIFGNIHATLVMVMYFLFATGFFYARDK